MSERSLIDKIMQSYRDNDIYACFLPEIFQKQEFFDLNGALSGEIDALREIGNAMEKKYSCGIFSKDSSYHSNYISIKKENLPHLLLKGSEELVRGFFEKTIEIRNNIDTRLELLQKAAGKLNEYLKKTTTDEEARKIFKVRNHYSSSTTDNPDELDGFVFRTQINFPNLSRSAYEKCMELFLTTFPEEVSGFFSGERIDNKNQDVHYNEISITYGKVKELFTALENDPGLQGRIIDHFDNPLVPFHNENKEKITQTIEEIIAAKAEVRFMQAESVMVKFFRIISNGNKQDAVMGFVELKGSAEKEKEIKTFSDKVEAGWKTLKEIMQYNELPSTMSLQGFITPDFLKQFIKQSEATPEKSTVNFIYNGKTALEEFVNHVAEERAAEKMAEIYNRQKPKSQGYGGGDAPSTTPPETVVKLNRKNPALSALLQRTN